MDKHCNTCATTKPASEFHKRAASKDGLSAKCKECARAYDLARVHNPKRVEQRRRYDEEGKNDPLWKKARAADKRNWWERNKEKRAAHLAVGSAMRSGKLVRQACEVCGDEKAEAHHDDYSKPLEVRWLCDRHHKDIHMAMRRGEMAKKEARA